MKQKAKRERAENFVKGGILQFTLREWWGLASRPRLWATFLVVVLLFAFTGPFGTVERMNPAERFTYWLILHGLAWSTAIFGAMFFDNLLEQRVPSLLLRLMAGSLIAALPIGVEVTLLDHAFMQTELTLSYLLAAVGVSVPLCALFCILTYMTTNREELRGEAVTAPVDGALANAQPVSPASPAGVPLARRLKPENRGVLIRLSAEDHYTEVVTAAGRELVLIRFADALTELGDCDGLQVHRSHWVARAAISAMERKNGKTLLRMADGAEVPVSRSFDAAVRERLAETG